MLALHKGKIQEAIALPCRVQVELSLLHSSILTIVNVSLILNSMHHGLAAVPRTRYKLGIYTRNITTNFSMTFC